MSWNRGQRVGPSSEENFDQENSDKDERISRANSEIQRRRLPSLYHGTWPMERDLWNSLQCGNDSSTIVASVMSFSSNTSTGVHYSNRNEEPGNEGKFDAKMDVIYSLLGMLLGDATGREDTTTLLALSSSAENCSAMRQSGCLPLLIQLIHAPERNISVRRGASRALFNIVRATQDEKQSRQELHVLELVEQLRDYSLVLRSCPENCEENSRHPISAMSLLTKLSFNETHRHVMCQMGGLHAVAEIIEVDHSVHESETNDPNCLALRKFAGMTLTNLTFGDSKNKSLLCSFGGFIKVWVAQLKSSNEDLHQVTASVLRNLSWRADCNSKKVLREMGSVPSLTKAAMSSRRELTLKSILSALWNLSAHCTTNKVDICAVDGALAFLVDMLSLKTDSKLAIVENAGGILRNVSSHVAIEEKYRAILRRKKCIPILVRLLKSPSSTVVSNACGTLWNLSARCLEDQKTLWDLGTVPILGDLVHSKHKMISMGASAALRNLLAAKHGANNYFRQSTSFRSVLTQDSETNEKNIDDNLQENRPLVIRVTSRSRSVETNPQENPEERPLSSKSWNPPFPRHPSSPLHDDDDDDDDDDDGPPKFQEESTEIIVKAEEINNENDDSQEDFRKSPYSERRKGSPAGSPYFERRCNENGSYEAEGDQPVDYSKQYMENNPSKKSQNTKIKAERGNENYPDRNPNLFGDYAETDLDQPTDYSLRYAEDDTDDEEKQTTRYFTVNEIEDTIKTYYTEGTPYETPLNFSNATSMSDLRLEDLKDGESSRKLMRKATNNKIKGFEARNLPEEKEEENLPEELNSNENEENLRANNPQEKTVYYYEEGTPGGISRVNSLSSLESAIITENEMNESVTNKVSGESADRREIKEEKVDGNSEEIPDPPVEKISQISVEKTPDKEGKVVTFGGENHYAEETPLMFSRCSSLGSLSGFEQFSIHDDRSSIISDFSRRTSGMVSPSELPDSPTQTVPPSPRHQKNPIDFSPRTSEERNSRLSSFSKFHYPAFQKPKSSFFEDDTNAFKEESTPIEFSAATSLSSLTIDDEIKLPEIPIEIKLEKEVEEEEEEEQEEEEKLEDEVEAEDEIDGREEEEVDDDEEEVDDENDVEENENNREEILSPIIPSLAVSQEEIAIIRQNGRKVVGEEHVSDCDEEDDEDILAACINMGMQNNRYRQISKKPDTKLFPTTSVSNLIRYQTSSTLDRLESNIFETRSTLSPIKTKLTLDVPIAPDTVHVYCTEDTPADISPVGSQSNLSALSMPSILEDFEKPEELLQETRNDLSDESSNLSGDDEKILDECIQSGMPKRVSPTIGSNSLKPDGFLPMMSEFHGGNCLSREVIGGDERSNNSFDDSPNQSDDDAILAECIESAMPKARRNLLGGKPSTSRKSEELKGDFENHRSVNQEKSSESEDSLSLSEEEEDMILAQCIRSGMPKTLTAGLNFLPAAKEDPRSIYPATSTSPRNFSPRHISQRKDLAPTAARDEFSDFATEDTPCNFSVISDISNLSINSNLD